MITRNAKLTVGTSATEVSPDRPTRKVIHIRNTGTSTITISFGESAVAETGYVLYPKDYINDSIESGYLPFVGYISAISSAAGGQLSIYERA